MPNVYYLDDEKFRRYKHALTRIWYQLCSAVASCMQTCTEVKFFGSLSNVRNDSGRCFRTPSGENFIEKPTSKMKCAAEKSLCRISQIFTVKLDGARV